MDIILPGGIQMDCVSEMYPMQEAVSIERVLLRSRTFYQFRIIRIFELY
jgi:hypothetical protein